MEQNQSMSGFPTVYQPSQTSINQIYLPHQYDSMATHYVHSLTSNPYYYFIPRYSYVTGSSYHAPSVPQLGFVQATIPTFFQESNFAPPEGYPEVLDSKERILEKTQVEKFDGSSKKVEKNLIDEQIVHILEPFRQLYNEREETLKSIFPGLYSKLAEFFKKVNTMVLNAVKSDNGGTLKRSLSMGSSSLKNEWFKVRPIDSEDSLITSSSTAEGKNVYD